MEGIQVRFYRVFLSYVLGFGSSFTEFFRTLLALNRVLLVFFTGFYLVLLASGDCVLLSRYGGQPGAVYRVINVFNISFTGFGSSFT